MIIQLVFVLYIKNKVSFKCISFGLVFLIGAVVIAEVKFVLLLLPCLFIIILLLNFNKKSICIFFITIAILGAGIGGLVEVYPKFKDFFSLGSIESYSSESYGFSGITRTNSFVIANDLISQRKENLMIGYGIGQADKVSSLKLSAFNIGQYIIENGYLGVGCLYGIFTYILYISSKLIKSKGNEFCNVIGYYGLFFGISAILATFINRSMVKINFAVMAWISIGVICKYYNIQKHNSSIL